MKTNKIILFLLLLSIGFFLFGAGYRVGEYRSASLGPGKDVFLRVESSKEKDVDFSLFWEVWDHIEKKYVDRSKISYQKMVFGAVRGMVASLDDPYTFFLDPEENKQSKDDLGGKFEGIGAQLGLKDGKIVVISPFKDSPAEKSGLRAGDTIVKVDKDLTKGLSLPQVVTRIRGEKGTDVVLTIERKGKEMSFTITRDVITINSVELTLERSTSCQKDCPQVAHLKLNQFGDRTVEEWDLAVENIVQWWNTGKIEGLVLDLRDNPGGYLESSVYLAGDFLKKGSVVVTQESVEVQDIEYRVERTGNLLEIPLVVLINEGSASASEILAGALHDHKRARLVGQKSFGKGSVQEVLDLSGNSGIHVTIAKWILPNGKWINGVGIEPDVKVSLADDEENTLTREADKQLDRAILELIQ